MTKMRINYEDYEEIDLNLIKEIVNVDITEEELNIDLSKMSNTGKKFIAKVLNIVSKVPVMEDNIRYLRETKSSKS